MMSNKNEVLVEVKGLSKKFSRSLKRSMVYGMRDVVSAMLGLKRNRSELRQDEFWAVKDISFSLKRGECLGLIGRNGAGKSTLLKMLNGLILPDEGSITMRGKVGALIELGAGFNPLLTGRENIFINGQLLGFTKAEIESKMDAILKFAEIGKFIDSPVQNYSSGMKVRLGFGVAAQMDPDVLIIDEVLAVGDLGFVLKCFNTIDEILPKTAVIFVSHNMPQVSRICSAIIMLENGKILYDDADVPKGIDMYYSRFASKENSNVIFDRGEEAALVSLQFADFTPTENTSIYALNHLEDLQINMLFRVREDISAPFVSLTVYDKEQRPVGVCQNDTGLDAKQIMKKENGYTFYKVRLVLPKINLSKGIYSITLTVNENFRSKPLLRLKSAGTFQVRSKNDIWPPVEFEGKWS
jgi:lipopolysaccharide transport system ATP-binding protein